MRSRSLYFLLLRMHPECFRRKYEDQMMWIFDESVESRGVSPLLVDAVVSLVRQWVLRSGNWRHGDPTMAADGKISLAEQLRQNSEALHRRAWRLNLLWMIGAFVVLLLSRVLSLWGPFVFAIFVNAIGMYVQSREGRRDGRRVDEFVALSLSRGIDDPHDLYRQRMEGRREGLLKWCGFNVWTTRWKAGWYLGGGYLIVILFISGLHILLQSRSSGASYDWFALLEFLSGLLVVLVSWRFVKKANKDAARAIQDELEAMDEPSKPQSV